MNTLIQLKKTGSLVFVALAVDWLALLPHVQAVSPPPDGCHPLYTTAEGCNALTLLTTGAGNTAIGWYSLSLNSSGSFNTGVGGGALALNNGDSNTAAGAAALLLNATGTQNTAIGTDAMVYNDTGNNNLALGAFALLNIPPAVATSHWVLAQESILLRVMTTSTSATAAWRPNRVRFA